MMLGQDGCLTFSLYFSGYLKGDRLIQNDLAISLFIHLFILGFALGVNSRAYIWIGDS